MAKPPYPPSLLDTNQILQCAFDDNTSTIRTTASSTIIDGNIKIIGPNENYLNPNIDGSINVILESIPSSNSTTINIYNEVFAVPSGVTTKIVTYTIPNDSSAVFQRATVSGENIARYDLLINNNTQDTVRTMFGGNLTQTFNFESGNTSGLSLQAGDIIKINVLQNRPSVANFNGRLQLLLI